MADYAIDKMGGMFMLRKVLHTISVASSVLMFGQSNDLFYAPNDTDITLFDKKGKPINGDITSKVSLWDAGTEVNEEPGIGPNQAPRQSTPNTGAEEHESVQLIGDLHDGFVYPKTSDVMRITVTPEKPSE